MARPTFRRWVWASVVLATSACKGEGGVSDDAPAPAEASGDGEPAPTPRAEPPPQAEPEPEPPPVGHAVAKLGAAMYLGPDPEGVGFELAPGPKTETADRPWGLVVFRTGKEDNGLVAVDTVPPGDTATHCAARSDALAAFRLRFWVAPDALRKVTTKPVQHEFSDGTSIALAPGVPLTPDGDGWVADADGVRLVLPSAAIGADAIGDLYEPGEAFSADAPAGTVYERDDLAYDGTTKLSVSGLYRSDDDLGVAHFGRTSVGARAGAKVRNRCAEIEVVVDEARFTPTLLGAAAEGSGHFLASPYDSAYAVGSDDEDVWGGLTGTEIGEAYGVGGLGLVGSGRFGREPTFEIAPGVGVLWESGAPAGQVLAKHTFDDKPVEKGGRLCFATALFEGSPSTLTLCFAPDDVRQIDAPGGGIGEGTIGLGSIEHIGKSSLGTGEGFGIGGGGFSHRKKVPSVRQAKATIKGDLDKDIIRRIVRAHINEVRYCYNQGLARDPALEGRITIDFVIAGSGKVSSSVVADDELSDAKVAKCAAKAVKRWKFPKPRDGGAVLVSYPFALSPG